MSASDLEARVERAMDTMDRLERAVEELGLMVDELLTVSSARFRFAAREPRRRLSVVEEAQS